MTDSTAKYGGASGARIDIQLDYVIKSGTGAVGRRVNEQAKWLELNTGTGLPRVWHITKTKYVMERLLPVPAGLLGAAELSKMMLALHTYVWSRPHATTFDLKEHRLKVGKLLAVHMPQDHALHKVMTGLLNLMMHERIQRCLTHGDPTFGNLMTRPGTRDFVITDPLPSTSAVPDIRVVDLGKVLQSIIGFEEARHGAAIHDATITPQHFIDAYVKSTDDSSGFDCSTSTVVYWCIVHLLRALPYAPEFDQRQKIKECITHAVGLL